MYVQFANGQFRSPWFTSFERAKLALAIIRRSRPSAMLFCDQLIDVYCVEWRIN